MKPYPCPILNHKWINGVCSVCGIAQEDAENVQNRPVDYDDRSDPDVPKSAGDAIINAVGSGNLFDVKRCENANIIVWSSGAQEQIEAALDRMGWKLERARPWKS